MQRCQLDEHHGSMWVFLLINKSHEFYLDCPRTCGLCTNGTCRDINSGCNTMTPLCRHVDWIDYMTTNCARTCDVCNTTTGSNCSDIATNCAPNVGLCTNTIYRELMLSQCCATCNATTATSSSLTSTCADTNSNCANWVRNGFCNSSFYSPAQRRQYCGRSCNLCWEDSRRRPTQWSSPSL